MSWSNEVTLEFIDLFRSEPSIWNPKHKFHKDKKKVAEAWKRISDEMHVSVECLKKKKETLMAAFRLNHKKKLSVRRLIVRPPETVQPVWAFYEPMAEFLSEVYDKAGNKSDDGALSTTFQEKWNPVVEVGVEELTGDSFDDQPASKRHRSKSPETRTAACENHLANTMTTLANVINIISKEVLNKEKDEDECDLYGRLTAMKLRQMPITERREMMYEIDTLLIQRSLKAEPS